MVSEPATVIIHENEAPKVRTLSSTIHLTSYLLQNHFFDQNNNLFGYQYSLSIESGGHKPSDNLTTCPMAGNNGVL